MCCFEKIQEVAPHKTAAVRPLPSHLTDHIRQALGTAEEVKTNSLAMFSNGLLYKSRGPTRGNVQQDEWGGRKRESIYY